MAPVGTQLWLYNATLHAPEAAQAMNTSVFQLSIGLGSLVGGVVADLGKSLGGSVGGSVGRALVRGALGGILRR